MNLWWEEVKSLNENLYGLYRHIDTEVDGHELLNMTGAIEVGRGTKICHGAVVRGPVRIGKDCLIGNNAFIRGPSIIGDRVSIGFSCEVKNAIIGDDVWVGPLCFVADSMVGDGAFFGALVRTSNMMLNKESVKVMDEGSLVDTGMQKLGSLISKNVNLGVGVVVLPGRVILPGTTIGPHIIVEKNLEPGVYTLKQEFVVKRST